MARDWKMLLYQGLPVPLQEVGISLYAWHLDRLYHGVVYEKELLRITESELDSVAAVRSFQEQRFVSMMAEARAHTKYYRQEFAQLPPVHGLEDLTTLPVLDKQRIRQHEFEFIDERFDFKKLFCEKTSGTTGTSLKIYWDKESIQKLWAAYEIRVRRAAGVDRHTPRAMMGGRPIVPGGAVKPPFWRYNYRWHQLYLSSYHISRSWAGDYIAAMRRAGSKWLTGYGSAIAALAESAMAEGIAPLQMKTVVVSGDTLQTGMRKSIETFFQCQCRDQYGQAEGVCWIMECEHGRLHVSPEFGILEILDPQGASCPPGKSGEMVVTGLINRAMPLIRYRIGDEAAWATEQSCACGQPFPIVEKLEGRMDDYLITTDGRKLGRLSTAMKASSSIHSAQIVQDRPGHAFLLVRPGSGYTRDAAALVKADVLSRVGGFDLDVVEVPEIPKTAVGKLKLVIRLEDKPEMHKIYEALIQKPGAW